MSDLVTAEQMLVTTIGNLPVFRAENDANNLIIIEDYLRQEDEGSNIFLYYLLTEVNTVEVRNNANVTVKRPAIVKVRSTFVGRSVEAVDSKTLKINESVEPNGYYNLPAIPYELMVQMDAFFRQIEKLHGTEAILILTFDPSYLKSANPSGGWGVLIPTQKNTGGHCNYEMANVMAIKPEHVLIVGSVHSHPSMKAYFSGTDHADQADWDGLHITYGWAPGSCALDTEHHIELYLGGVHYPFNPQQIFGSYPAPVVNTEVINEWSTKVSKETFTQSTGHSASDYSGRGNIIGGSSNSFSSGGTLKKAARAIVLPDNAPLPTQNTIICIMNNTHEANIYRCKACSAPISQNLLARRRCLSCSTFFIFSGERVEDINTIRANDPQAKYCIEVDVDKAEKPIILWAELDGHHTFSNDLRKSSLASPKG